MSTEREQAIADMEDARLSHVAWGDFLRSGQRYRPTTTDIGSAEHHEEWVAKYDRVVALLRECSCE